MKTVTIIITALLFSANLFAEAEKIKISGTVTSADDGSPVPGVNVIEKGTNNGIITNIDGYYEISVANRRSILVFSFIGLVTEEIKVGKNNVIDVSMETDIKQLCEVVVTAKGAYQEQSLNGSVAGIRIRGKASQQNSGVYGYQSFDQIPPQFNTEGYATIHENEFLTSLQNPLSTFSIDVDAASYSNLRRFLNNGQKPPIDAIRIEEMVNYFSYEYAEPKGDDPFSITTEIAGCPWNEKHQLLHIGLQGNKIETKSLPASNLVFLIDVSGSMQAPNKLPLLKSAFRLLTEQMRENDRVAIVVYAGAAGLVLPSTSGSEKEKITAALESLTAGGSTAGGAGIKLAYEIAKTNYIDGGNNRIVLATDGDFNIGASSNAEMERLIEQKRDEGIFLTVTGFGMGNYKDDKMEILADKGNGNYAYIDNLQEAKKVFVTEFGGTMYTIAKDVKLQLEFNPVNVQAYRLIGYENRLLNKEDFNDDKKDAGELGSGHTVTALYEIIPAGVESEFIKSVDPLKYQQGEIKTRKSTSDELVTLKLRYKAPTGSKSKLIAETVTKEQNEWESSSENFRWSAAVASFGMLLRESQFAQNTSLDSVLEMANGARGSDLAGYRAEFIRLVESSRFLASRK